MGYRAEIDGLRAIAVLSVLFYHAQIVVLGHDVFGGGFIGVDIFFVISGYLITRIILSEVFEKGSFNFARFYDRRARRILPILFVVILVSAPFAWRYLLPGDFVEYSKSIISTLLFSSNFFFYFGATEYGADSSLLKPFLHTWSLGIEEQFYFIFPVLLLVFYKFVSRHLLAVLIVMLLMSLVFAEFIGTKDVDLNFYLPMSRFWELIFGSVLAYTELKHGPIRVPARKILPIIGLGLVFYALIFFDENTRHPGFITLLPVVGIALVIAFSSREDIVGKLLGSKLFVAVGLISYSLYLWHFPIFAFSRMSNNAPDIYDKLGWIALALGLACLSYFLIERPFRTAGRISTRWMVVSLAVLFSGIIAFQLTSLGTNGFESRISEIFKAEKFLEKPWEDLKDEDGKPCYPRSKGFCKFGDDTSKKVHLVGDSHMGAIQGDLVKRLSDRFNISVMSSVGCWPILDTNRHEVNGALDGGCTAAYQNHRIDEILKTDESIVILSGRLPLYLTTRHFDNTEGGREGGKIGGGYWKSFKPIDGTSREDKIVESLMLLMDKGHKVIVVYPIPEVGVHVPKRLLALIQPEDKDLSKWLGKKRITTSYQVYKDRTKSSFELLDGIEHENLYRVYPHELFCDNQLKGRCVTYDDKHIFYSDDDHPSRKGAEMINDLIMEKVDEISASESR